MAQKMNKISKLKVLELFSGIGGMHYALKESGFLFEVCAAMDLNSVAQEIYTHNFPEIKLIARCIEAIPVEDFDKWAADMILMSPPCQPFTRQGLKKDVDDIRSKPFLHLLESIPRFKKKPSYILIENVKGFETSEAHGKLIQMLDENNYHYQEFLLTPLQFGIPNNRLRYFLIAKLKPMQFPFTTKSEIWTDIPDDFHHLLKHRNVISDKQLSDSTNHTSAGDILTTLTPSVLVEKDLEKYTKYCQKLSEFLVVGSDSGDLSSSMLTENHLRHFMAMDIVKPDSRKCCCFTKGYGHKLDGSGSVIQMADEKDIYDGNRDKTIDPNDFQQLKKFKLRFFTPEEIARLMCFPADFDFPQNVTVKQKYRTLGNSLNVHIVSVLIKLMVLKSVS